MKKFEQITGLVDLEELSIEAEEINDVTAGVSTVGSSAMCICDMVPERY